MNGHAEQSGVVIYDGSCHLCNGAVAFVRQRDSSARFEFVPGQSDLARQLLRHYNIQESLDETFILIQDGHCYYRSDAALKVAARLDGGWRFLAMLRFVPAGLRDWIYNLVASNRYRWFGKQ